MRQSCFSAGFWKSHLGIPSTRTTRTIAMKFHRQAPVFIWMSRWNGLRLRQSTSRLSLKTCKSIPRRIGLRGKSLCCSKPRSIRSSRGTSLPNPCPKRSHHAVLQQYHWALWSAFDKGQLTHRMKCKSNQCASDRSAMGDLQLPSLYSINRHPLLV